MQSIRLGAELPFDLYSQVRVDLLTYLAFEILEHVRQMGALKREYESGTLSTESSGSVKRQRLPMYARSAASLPPLSQATLPRWWRVTSTVFDQWFPHPITVPWMRKLAESGASNRQVRRIVKRRLRQKLVGLARG